jgi:hypothetical protein
MLNKARFFTGVNMLTKSRKIWVVGLALTLLLTSCKSEPEVASTVQVKPEQILTAAAETANVKLTEIAAYTPTEAPTGTPTQPPTATTMPTATQALATATLTYVPQTGNLSDRMEFVQDISIPDFTTFAPNQPFKKTWRVKNIGTSTWTPAYTLVYHSGNQLGGPASVPLEKEVKPGETVDLSVNLVSPASTGQYTSYWIMRNPLGSTFGVGANANQAIYTIINVASNGTVIVTAAQTTGTPGTPTATLNATTQPSQTGSIESITVKLVKTEGSFPNKILTFEIAIVMKKAATVTLEIEAVSTTPNKVFGKVDPYTANLPAGTKTISFQMTVTEAVEGWVRVNSTAPDQVKSNIIELAIT